MEPIIKVEKLEKSFKGKRALDGISFEVRKGEILCFLGPNGAGKSTTINILTTALEPDGGRISYNGAEIGKAAGSYKGNLGIVPQDLALYEEISAEKNVAFYAALYGLRGRELKEKVGRALEFAGLSDKRRDKVKTFSGGMKRRLNIACAIAHEPGIIIMDEPTVGIDPQSRNHILNSIKELRRKGSTVIYTTHYMEEVEEISTRIIIIDHGKIIAEGTKEELKDRLAGEKLYRIYVDDAGGLEKDEFFRIEGVRRVEVDSEKITVSTLTGIENLDKMIALLINKGIRINNLVGNAPSLEMVFLKLTGRTLRD